jgi:hypothetical protein
MYIVNKVKEWLQGVLALVDKVVLETNLNWFDLMFCLSTAVLFFYPASTLLSFLE